MADKARPRPCPECSKPLRAEPHTVMSPRSCASGHGWLFETEELRRVVGDGTIKRLSSIADESPALSKSCPVCLQKLHPINVQRVPASACVICGALWFERGAIEGHVREGRRREWGASSFAARDDVERLGANVQPVEVVAGLLAYYELEPTGAPNKA